MVFKFLEANGLKINRTKCQNIIPKATYVTSPKDRDNWFIHARTVDNTSFSGMYCF